MEAILQLQPHLNIKSILQFQPHLNIKSICYLSLKPIIFLHQNFRSLTRSRVTMCSSSPGDSDKNGNDDGDKSIDLDNIRRSLFRQEDTIIFNLLERAKYSQDSVEYENNDDLKGSIIVKKLVFQDEMPHNQLGRYKCEEEKFLVDPIRPDLQYSKVLDPCAHSINMNKKIRNTYFEKILPELLKARNDDESIIELVLERNDDDSGSIADCDSLCLQALSKIIHYGKFVAEAKFQEVPSKYEAAIKAKDRELLLELLTDKTEEAIVKKRVELKATIFGQVVQIDEAYNVVNPTYKIKPSFIVELFENNIIPLSKEVQVEYLLRRLD